MHPNYICGHLTIENNNLKYSITQFAHLGFISLLISLPLSKGIASVSIVYLLILSLIQALQWPKQTLAAIKQYPSVSAIALLFFAYLLGLVHTEQLQKGLNFVYIQNSFLVIPFIVLVNRQLVQQYLPFYLSCFIGANLVHALIFMLFNALPYELSLGIANTLNESIQYLIGRFGLIEYLGFIKPFKAKSLSFGLYSPFIERIQASYLISLALLSVYWLISRKYGKRWLWLLVAFFLGTTSLLLGGRGGQIGGLLASFIWLISLYHYYLHFFFSKKIGKNLSISLLLGGLIVLSTVLPYTLYQNVPSIKKRYRQLFWELDIFYNKQYQKYDYTHFTGISRIMSWKHNWAIIQDHPIIGVGSGDYRLAMQKRYTADKFTFPVNAHHQFLYIWASIGIGGLFIFLGLLLAFILTIYYKSSRWYTTYGLSILIFYLFIMQIDAPIIYQVGNTTFCTFLSILGVYDPNKN